VTQLPDRLRASYREATGTVPPTAIRDLELAPGRKAWAIRPGVRRRLPDALRRPGRVLVPLAAAASVAAIAVAATVVIPRLVGNTPGHHHRSSRPRTQPQLGALPRFIVVNHLDAGGPGTSKLLTVITTATGHVDAHLNAPAGQVFDVVAGTSGGQTFFVAARGSGPSYPMFFYKFTVSADGQSSPLTPIPVRGVPPRSTAVALAASADGSRLAVSLDGDGKNTGHGLNSITGEIAIIDVASGTIIGHWPHTLTEDFSSDLSISADGTLIGFTNFRRNGTQVSRVMATSAPSGPDTRVSRIVVRNASAAMLNPSGTVMYALARSPGQQTFESGHILVAYDVASGKLVKVLHVWPAKAGLGTPVAAPAGGFALVPVLISAHKAKACGLGWNRKHHCVRYFIPRSGLVSVNLVTGALTRLPFLYPQFPSFGVFAW
jgi:hypothetical protein